MKRYMMSDIHGFLEAFEAALKKTDLSGKNQLILLGDYIDYGPDGRAVLEKVRALQEKYGSEKVIALMGNHEKALLDWLEEYADVNRHIGSVERYRSREWLASDADGDYETLHSFLKEEHFQEFLEKRSTPLRGFQKCRSSTADVRRCGGSDHLDASFSYFYETERKILVHAGIAEWGGKDWLCVTSRELMVGKTTVSRGAFYKDVIAGHISRQKSVETEYMTVSGMTVRVIIISTEPLASGKTSGAGI